MPFDATPTIPTKTTEDINILRIALSKIEEGLWIKNAWISGQHRCVVEWLRNI